MPSRGVNVNGGSEDKSPVVASRLVLMAGVIPAGTCALLCVRPTSLVLALFWLQPVVTVQ